MQINAQRLAEIRRRLAVDSQLLENGCIVWTGYRQPNGYGYINIGKFHIAAHRAALIAAGVEFANELDVCHRCDCRPCVNPAHLYPGTRKQNMADCTERGRHNKPRGEAHWCTKLDAAAVADIRSRRASGEFLKSIAARHGIHYSTVLRIARGDYRKELPL